MLIQPFVNDYQRQQLNISPNVIIVIDDERGRIKKAIYDGTHSTMRNKVDIERFTFIFLNKKDICVKRSTLDEQFYESLIRSNLIARIYPCQGSYNSFLTEELPDWMPEEAMIKAVFKFLRTLRNRYFLSIFTQLIWNDRTRDFNDFIEKWPHLSSSFNKFRNEYIHQSTRTTTSLIAELLRSLEPSENLALENFVANLIEIPDIKESINHIYDIFGVKNKDTSYAFPDINIGISDRLIPWDRESNNWFEPIFIWVGESPKSSLQWDNNRRTLAATLFFLLTGKIETDIQLKRMNKKNNDKAIQKYVGKLMSAYFGDEANDDKTLLSDFSRAKSDFKRNIMDEANKLGVRWNIFRKEESYTYFNIPPENIHIPDSLIETLTEDEINE